MSGWKLGQCVIQPQDMYNMLYLSVTSFAVAFVTFLSFLKSETLIIFFTIDRVTSASFATLLTVDNYDNWVVKSLVKLLFTQGVHSFGKPKEAFKVFTFDVKDCDMLNCQGFDDLTSMTIQHINILCLCNMFAIQNLVTGSSHKC